MIDVTAATLPTTSETISRYHQPDGIVKYSSQMGSNSVTNTMNSVRIGASLPAAAPLADALAGAKRAASELIAGSSTIHSVGIVLRDATSGRYLIGASGVGLKIGDSVASAPSDFVRIDPALVAVTSGDSVITFE